MEKRFQNEKLKISIADLIRRIRMGRSSSLVRTLALRAKGRRFKSGSAHQLAFLLVESTLLAELQVENLVIRSFKWFSNVLLRLKPRSLDFWMISFSRYKTRLVLFVNCNSTRADAMGGLC